MKSFRIDPSGCWIWVGLRDPHGYGLISIKGVNRRASRYSFSLHNGEIPKDICVCHSCDVASCVNPHHLFLGTQRENNHDMRHKGRHIKGEAVNTAKLTEEQAKEIASLKGHNQRLLAERYGIDRTMVGRIMRKQAWKHLW